MKCKECGHETEEETEKLYGSKYVTKRVYYIFKRIPFLSFLWSTTEEIKYILELNKRYDDVQDLEGEQDE